MASRKKAPAKKRTPVYPPGHELHDHWACGPEAHGMTERDPIWQSYGDRYPGGYCRWLTNSPEGMAKLAQAQRREQALALRVRVEAALLAKARREKAQLKAERKLLRAATAPLVEQERALVKAEAKKARRANKAAVRRQ